MSASFFEAIRTSPLLSLSLWFRALDPPLQPLSPPLRSTPASPVNADLLLSRRSLRPPLTEAPLSPSRSRRPSPARRHHLSLTPLLSLFRRRIVFSFLQIEPGHFETFLRVYDGRGGPEAACYARENLFQNFGRLIVEEGGMSLDVLQKAFLVTDKGFPSIIKKKLSIMPQLATVGACYLAGLICDGLLYVANLGDAYAVLGRFDRDNREVLPIQLTSEHCMP